MEINQLMVLRPNGYPFSSSIGHLGRFLFRGVARRKANGVVKEMDQGLLTNPDWSRAEFLCKAKEVFEDYLIFGKAEATVKSALAKFASFCAFLDDENLSYDISEIERGYLEYAEHLFRRLHSRTNKLKPESAKVNGEVVGHIIDTIFGYVGHAIMFKKTRLKIKSKRKSSISREADKQNLEETSRMGEFLCRLNQGLSPEAILGSLPLNIPMPQRLVPSGFITLLGWLEHAEHPLEKVPRDQLNFKQKQQLYKALRRRSPVEKVTDRSRKRYLLIRVVSELIIFMAETGMNVAPSRTIQRSRFKYVSLGDRWEVKAYKARRHGEVTFKIDNEYRPILKEYLTFLEQFFPESESLFPGLPNQSNWYKSLKDICDEHGIPWIPPRQCRNTRLNYFLRRSGDPDLSADESQHLKETLLADYERPNQQRAMTEITKFHTAYDPLKSDQAVRSLIQTDCDGKPAAVLDKPASVAQPNCKSPSGCLWCKKRFDWDSSDYVWNLVSFRYLKTIEASGIAPGSVETPPDIVVNRLTDMVNEFKKLGGERVNWVAEAMEYVEAGTYHPNWSPVIEFLEGE